MSWRNVILENRWQKLFSVCLAVMIWLTVRSTDGLGVRQTELGPTRLFEGVPITVLTSAADLGRYRVTPETVRIELRGEANILQRLPPADIEAYVNLLDLRATPQSVLLHVNPPPGTDLVSIAPLKVLVDRLPNEAAP